METDVVMSTQDNHKGGPYSPSHSPSSLEQTNRPDKLPHVLVAWGTDGANQGWYEQE